MRLAGSLSEIVDLLVHFVGGLDHFGIGLVAALATIRLMNSSTTLTLGLLGIACNTVPALPARRACDGSVARGIGGHIQVAAMLQVLPG